MANENLAIQRQRAAVKSRKAWAAALRSGEISTIRDAWRSRHIAVWGEAKSLEEKFLLEAYEASGQWIAQCFEQFSKLSYDTDVLDGTLAKGADTLGTASVLEAALVLGDRKLLADACAWLKKGQFYRDARISSPTWSKWASLPAKTKEVFASGRVEYGFADMLRSVYSLAFLMDDADAYMQLLRAGLPEPEWMISSLCSFTREGADASYRKAWPLAQDVLDPLGAVEFDRWLEFLAFRKSAYDAAGKFAYEYDNVPYGGAEKIEALGAGVREALKMGPTLKAETFWRAFFVKDFALARELHEAGANPNEMRDHYWPPGSSGMEHMSTESLRLALAHGFNPTGGAMNLQVAAEGESGIIGKFVRNGDIERVDICLRESLFPVPLECTIEYISGPEVGVPLVIEARQRAAKAGSNKGDFERIEALLLNEVKSRKANAFANELGSEIRVPVEPLGGSRKGGL